MTVTLELPPDVEARVAAKAAKKGIALPDYLQTIIKADITATEGVFQEQDTERQDALEILHAWRTENATTDPIELEKRRQDWKEFKTALNESHTSDRVLFP